MQSRVTLPTVRRALSLTALDAYLSVVLQLASTVVVARLLTPEQIGIFAVAAVFAALASTVRDFGVGEFLIQEKELSEQAIRAALAVNIMVSWGMAALLAALSSPAAVFYGQQGIAEVMRVQAVSFLLIPFGAVTMAWFRREMRFRPFVTTRIVGNVVAFATAVTLAWHGFGYMSLAWSSLAGVATTVLVASIQRPSHLPVWPSLAGTRRVLSFGKHVSGIYIFAQLGKGAPEIILGKAQDMTAVGLFSRGQGLVEIFNMLVLRAITPVCLPYFASEARAHGTPRGAQLRAMQYITGVGWPFLAAMAVLADVAIRVVYGPQWNAAVNVARILCAAACIEIAFFTVKEALLASNLAAIASRLQIITQSLRLLGLCAAFWFGMIGAAWGLLAGALLGAALSCRAARVHLGLSLREMIGVLAPSAAVALICVTPVAALRILFPGPSHLALVTVAAVASGTLAWLGGLRLTRHPIGDELRRILGNLRKRRKH